MSVIVKYFSQGLRWYLPFPDQLYFYVQHDLDVRLMNKIKSTALIVI